MKMSQRAAATKADWWRQAVVYQIYPRSFADSDADGLGDLRGILSRVPYLTSLGIDHDPMLELAMEMEQIALKDDYFISKKLYPNVDFYSGIIFRAIGIPTSMFTVLFAVARTVGWISQWNEMIEDPDQKIGRPRQLYSGQTERPYKPLHMRG